MGKPALSYISVCSGVEAATVAWEPLGLKPLVFSEIDKFPSQVLAHHYPDVPNAGDFTKIQGKEYGQPDILVGGTPCQSFSVAGLRGGMSDERGNLALEFVRLAERSNPEFILWENVPGVLSSTKGQDFRSLLHGLTGVDLPVPTKGWKTFGVIAGLPGHYSVAWRVLDAQYTGVPQRRRRVFLVGHIRDWRRAVSVLLERESLLWNPAPSREKRESPTYDVAPCLTSSGRGVERTGDTRGQDPVVAVNYTEDWPAEVATTLDANFGDKQGLDNQHINGGGGGCSYQPCWWDGGQVSQTLDAVLAKGQTMPEKNRFPAVLVPMESKPNE